MFFREDIQAAFANDPAAVSTLEVLLAYPGFHAVVFYRIAHWLHQRRVPLVPRLISHLARFLTGVEIHPGATIGRRFFIDHGMGVVIGETSVTGDDCVLYQGVTLGGTGKQRGKRHPTLGDGVVVGVGAKVLGAITVGDNSRVGASSVVLKDVPPNSTVVGVPGRVVAYREVNGGFVHRLPDPDAEAMGRMQGRIDRLEERIRSLEEGRPGSSNRRQPERQAEA